MDLSPQSARLFCNGLTLDEFLAYLSFYGLEKIAGTISTMATLYGPVLWPICILSMAINLLVIIFSFFSKSSSSSIWVGAISLVSLIKAASLLYLHDFVQGNIFQIFDGETSVLYQKDVWLTKIRHCIGCFLKRFSINVNQSINFSRCSAKDLDVHDAVDDNGILLARFEQRGIKPICYDYGWAFYYQFEHKKMQSQQGQDVLPSDFSELLD